MTQEKQHGTEVARLQAELKQAREQGQLMQASCGPDGGGKRQGLMAGLHFGL